MEGALWLRSPALLLCDAEGLRHGVGIWFTGSVSQFSVAITKCQRLGINKFKKVSLSPLHLENQEHSAIVSFQPRSGFSVIWHHGESL